MLKYIKFNRIIIIQIQKLNVNFFQNYKSRIEIVFEGRGPRQNSEESRCQESVLVVRKMSILLKKSKRLEKAGISFASSVVSPYVKYSIGQLILTYVLFVVSISMKHFLNSV